MFIFLFVFAIAFFIMFHEFGHFATAKLFGMKAERFFLGFGPTLWSFQHGETEYGIKAIPAGGFVKIVGMNRFEKYDPADEARTFHSKPAWQRVIVLAAGSVTHFICAIVLLVVALSLFSVPVLRDGDVVAGNNIGEVVADTPAATAGLQAGDVITSVNGTATADFDEVRTAIQPLADRTVPLEVTRDGVVRALEITLGRVEGEDGTPQGFLGVRPGLALINYGFAGAIGQSLGSGPYGVRALFSQTVTGLGTALSPDSLTRWFAQVDPETARSADGPISLVGAGQVVGELGNLGEFASILLLLASLNVVLGLLNLLPLPPLDGGHIATLAVEETVNFGRRKRGKPGDYAIDPARVTPIALAVILFFGMLSLTALYIDIVNPASQLLR